MFSGAGASPPRISEHQFELQEEKTKAVFSPHATVGQRARVPQSRLAFGAQRQIATSIQTL